MVWRMVEDVQGLHTKEDLNCRVRRKASVVGRERWVNFACVHARFEGI